MQGFSIVFFAVHSMARKPGTTLRLTVLPWAVAIAAVFAIAELIAGMGLSALGPDQFLVSIQSPGYLPALVISAFVVCMIGAWVALGWHRHILLCEEPVAVLPRNNSDAFDSYFDAAMKFAVLALMMVLMIRFLMVPLVPVLGFVGPGGKLISLAINALMIAILLRHALVLPGAAIGQPMSMADSWKATQGYSGPIYAIALTVVLAVDLAGLVPGSNLAAYVLQFTASWAGMILSIGVITVLYGVRVQGRRLII